MQLLDEQLFPVATAVVRVTGKRPHPSSIYRWRTQGVRGVRLETVLAGGSRMTSLEGVRRFIESSTRAAEQGPGQLQLPGRPDAGADERVDRIADAQRQLRQYGLDA